MERARVDSKDGGCTELRWMVKIVKERDSERIALCEIFMGIFFVFFSKNGVGCYRNSMEKIGGKICWRWGKRNLHGEDREKL